MDIVVLRRALVNPEIWAHIQFFCAFITIQCGNDKISFTFGFEVVDHDFALIPTQGKQTAELMGRQRLTHHPEGVEQHDGRCQGNDITNKSWKFHIG